MVRRGRWTVACLSEYSCVGAYALGPTKPEPASDEFRYTDAGQVLFKLSL